MILDTIIILKLFCFISNELCESIFMENPMRMVVFIGMLMFTHTLFLNLNLSIAYFIYQTRLMGKIWLCSQNWHWIRFGLPTIPTATHPNTKIYQNSQLGYVTSHRMCRSIKYQL